MVSVCCYLLSLLCKQISFQILILSRLCVKIPMITSRKQNRYVVTHVFLLQQNLIQTLGLSRYELFVIQEQICKPLAKKIIGKMCGNKFVNVKSVLGAIMRLNIAYQTWCTSCILSLTGIPLTTWTRKW